MPTIRIFTMRGLQHTPYRYIPYMWTTKDLQDLWLAGNLPQNFHNILGALIGHLFSTPQHICTVWMQIMGLWSPSSVPPAVSSPPPACSWPHPSPSGQTPSPAPSLAPVVPSDAFHAVAAGVQPVRESTCTSPQVIPLRTQS